MTLPLAGIKIVDFSEHGFVPSAAAALADWGADVVKIERLDGDPMRSVIRNGLSPDADGTDYLFELTNRNKRGIGFFRAKRGSRPDQSNKHECVHSHFHSILREKVAFCMTSSF